jgi:hypothetical protein
MTVNRKLVSQGRRRAKGRPLVRVRVRQEMHDIDASSGGDGI